MVCVCHTLFLNELSSHRFIELSITSYRCVISSEEALFLKNYVKEKSLKQKKHINTIWAELKKKHNFSRYREMDCNTFRRIKKDIDQEESPNYQ